MELNGADIVVRCLAEEGVEHVFGYPGGAVLYIYDAIFKQDKFQHILVRHEQAAVHAADAYSRSSQKVGVCIVTSGPGVTNAVTGIATAYMDSIPMVIISGRCPLRPSARTLPGMRHRRHHASLRQAQLPGARRQGPGRNHAPRVLHRAHRPSRPGAGGYPQGHHRRAVQIHAAQGRDLDAFLRARQQGPPGQIKKAVQMLLAAERPMIYTGGGVILSNAAPELNKLVTQLGAPCTSTLMGLGGYPASSGQFVGMPGMHGTYEANMAMQHCDVLLAIGARFDDRVIGNPKHFAQNARKIIHIDIDPSSISKRVRVDVPIVGNVKDVLADLSAQYDIAAAEHKPASIAKWWEQVETWRGKECLKFANSDEVIKPQYVVEKLWEVTGGDAFVTSDVGQHQMWAAQYYKFDKPRRWINSGGLGTMGVGLPYAMGVQMANPGHDVAVITGEASIQMNIQELSTCHQYRLTPKIVCLNNRFLGMVRQWQQIDYGSRYSESYMDSLPDFVKVAEAYGHVGLRIERPADVEPALREAFKKHKDRLVFLDFITDRTENVWPMVKAGRGLTEMLLGSEDL